MSGAVEVDLTAVLRRAPVMARCPFCGLGWAVVYLPVPLAEAARLMQEHARCPRCGTAGELGEGEGK